MTTAKRTVVMTLDERTGNHEAVASPYIEELGFVG